MRDGNFSEEVIEKADKFWHCFPRRKLMGSMQNLGMIPKSMEGRLEEVAGDFIE